MTVAEWIALAGAAGQLIIGAFFFGATYQTIRNLVQSSEKTDKRVDSIEVRVNDHTARIGWLEGAVRREEQ